MNIEFHYYITFLLAVKAGISSSDASVIAYASQYVDDNDFVYTIDKGRTTQYQNYISQTMNILKPQTERLRVYPCFHFIPGEIDSLTAQRKDERQHLLNTTPNSLNANYIMDKAIETENLYRIGIATHAFADTWAHQNFVGYEDKFNLLKGFFEMLIPNIGHADAGRKPDIPFLIWTDKRLVHEGLIHNKKRFLDAACKIYAKFCRYTDLKIKDRDIALKWIKLERELDTAIGTECNKNNGKSSERINRYKAITEPPRYNKKKWFIKSVKSQAVSKRTGHGDRRPEMRYFWKENYSQSHWYKFQEAVKYHQRFVMELLKTKFDSIGLSKVSNF